jgi:hypothetical protein
MLHLYRPGELSLVELRELDDHLRTCAECAALKARIARSEVTLRAVRDFIPAAPDVERAVGAITRGLGESVPAGRSILTAGWLARLLGRFELPAFQLAGALGALLITGSFLIQQIGLLNEVSELETRLAGRVPGREQIEVAYVVPRIPKDLSLDVDRVLQAAGGAIGTDAQGRITISRARAADLRRSPLRQILTAVASERMLGIDRKTLDDINDYLIRNMNTVLRTTRRGGF